MERRANKIGTEKLNSRYRRRQSSDSAKRTTPTRDRQSPTRNTRRQSVPQKVEPKSAFNTSKTVKTRTPLTLIWQRLSAGKNEKLKKKAAVVKTAKTNVSSSYNATTTRRNEPAWREILREKKGGDRMKSGSTDGPFLKKHIPTKTVEVLVERKTERLFTKRSETIAVDVDKLDSFDDIEPIDEFKEFFDSLFDYLQQHVPAQEHRFLNNENQRFQAFFDRLKTQDADQDEEPRVSIASVSSGEFPDGSEKNTAGQRKSKAIHDQLQIEEPADEDYEQPSKKENQRKSKPRSKAAEELSDDDNRAPSKREHQKKSNRGSVPQEDTQDEDNEEVVLINDGYGSLSKGINQKKTKRGSVSREVDEEAVDDDYDVARNSYKNSRRSSVPQEVEELFDDYYDSPKKSVARKSPKRLTVSLEEAETINENNGRRGLQRKSKRASFSHEEDEEQIDDDDGSPSNRKSQKKSERPPMQLEEDEELIDDDDGSPSNRKSQRKSERPPMQLEEEELSDEDSGEYMKRRSQRKSKQKPINQKEEDEDTYGPVNGQKNHTDSIQKSISQEELPVDNQKKMTRRSTQEAAEDEENVDGFRKSQRKSNRTEGSLKDDFDRPSIQENDERQSRTSTKQGSIEKQIEDDNMSSTKGQKQISRGTIVQVEEKNEAGYESPSRRGTRASRWKSKSKQSSIVEAGEASIPGGNRRRISRRREKKTNRDNDNGPETNKVTRSSQESAKSKQGSITQAKGQISDESDVKSTRPSQKTKKKSILMRDSVVQYEQPNDAEPGRTSQSDDRKSKSSHVFRSQAEDELKNAEKPFDADSKSEYGRTSRASVSQAEDESPDDFDSKAAPGKKSFINEQKSRFSRASDLQAKDELIDDTRQAKKKQSRCKSKTLQVEAAVQTLFSSSSSLEECSSIEMMDMGVQVPKKQFDRKENFKSAEIRRGSDFDDTRMSTKSKKMSKSQPPRNEKRQIGGEAMAVSQELDNLENLIKELMRNPNMDVLMKSIKTFYKRVKRKYRGAETHSDSKAVSASGTLRPNKSSKFNCAVAKDNQMNNPVDDFMLYLPNKPSTMLPASDESGSISEKASLTPVHAAVSNQIDNGKPFPSENNLQHEIDTMCTDLMSTKKDLAMLKKEIEKDTFLMAVEDSALESHRLDSVQLAQESELAVCSRQRRTSERHAKNFDDLSSLLIDQMANSNLNEIKQKVSETEKLHQAEIENVLKKKLQVDENGLLHKLDSKLEQMQTSLINLGKQYNYLPIEYLNQNQQLSKWKPNETNNSTLLLNSFKNCYPEKISTCRSLDRVTVEEIAPYEEASEGDTLFEAYLNEDGNVSEYESSLENVEKNG